MSHVRIFIALAASTALLAACDQSKPPAPTTTTDATAEKTTADKPAVAVKKTTDNTDRVDANADARVVKAGCAGCIFESDKAQGCELAVKIDGEVYMVDGFKIDELGDEHADDGMCNMMREARVVGKVQGERFVATSFELLPADSHELP